MLIFKILANNKTHKNSYLIDSNTATIAYQLTEAQERPILHHLAVGLQLQQHSQLIQILLALQEWNATRSAVAGSLGEKAQQLLSDLTHTIQ